jgi:hypothetical protein
MSAVPGGPPTSLLPQTLLMFPAIKKPIAVKFSRKENRENF